MNSPKGVKSGVIRFAIFSSPVDFDSDVTLLKCLIVNRRSVSMNDLDSLIVCQRPNIWLWSASNY